MINKPLFAQTSRLNRLSWNSLLLIAVLSLCANSARAQYNPPPAPGPFYFVSDTLSSQDQFYWRNPQHFAGIKTIQNFNLLAAVLGDNPANLLGPGQKLVTPEMYSLSGSGVLLQPFACTTKGSSKKLNLPLGPNLQAFLDDPLGGVAFDLTLPFTDPNVALSSRSAAIRTGTSASVWHTAVDFDYSGDTTREFDVVAPADGIIEGNSPTSDTLAIRHTAANGLPFLTVYDHLNLDSKQHLTVGASVRRGEKLGRIQLIDGYAHLHFAVAVKGPAAVINHVQVPELWYVIDPFGVYDYRRNSDSATDYNYVPNNTLLPPTRGVRHAYVWRTDPPIGSVLLPEDCVAFNPENLIIRSIAGRAVLMDGAHALFSFPNVQEAALARQIIRDYGMNSSCFIGRPDPSLRYMLVDGQSPVGRVEGEDCVSFNPNLLELEPLSDGRYRLVSGNHALFVFPNLLEAGNALSIIFEHGFTRSCFVGRPDPSLSYLRADIGAFTLQPAQAAVKVNEPITYAFTWNVPPPLNWHNLDSLHLRIRDDQETILSLTFDESNNTFSTFNEQTGAVSRALPAGTARSLTTPVATVHLAHTSVVGSGATGPSVTLHITLSFNSHAAGRTFAVEVTAVDDFGNHDDFASAGSLTVIAAR